MATIPFHKLHGLGNDFVLIDLRDDKRTRVSKSVIMAFADRKRGVGFDQLLVLRKARSGSVDAALDIYNADGSIAEMCGNGLRAAALFIWRAEVARLPLSRAPGRAKALPRELLVATCAGPRAARALEPIRAETTTARIECDMGVPEILPVPKPLARGVRLGSRTELPTCVDVGNPHAVSFVYPLRGALLETWGAMLENHRAFPHRTNAEFVRVKDVHTIEVQVWERGVGVTEACGTGAVASAVAAIHRGQAQSPVRVRFPGGEALVRWDGKAEPAFLTGTAHYVYSGQFQV